MTAPAIGYFGAPVTRARTPNANRFRAAADEATDAATAGAREDLSRDIGQTFGNLNAIGALRSGAAATGVQDATNRFSEQVARAGSANAYRAVEDEQAANEASANRAADESRFGRDFGLRERQFGADEAYRTGRAGRADMESDRSFDFGKGRAARSDFESDRGYGENARQFNAQQGLEERRFGADNAYRVGRASRADMESDRGFSEDTRRYNTDTGFRSQRANRADLESDRSFGEDTRRFNADDSFRQGRAIRGDYESDRGYGYQTGRDQVMDARDQRDYEEDVRRYGQERADAMAAQKRQAKASKWGAFGSIVGAGLGSFLGPVGTAVGSRFGRSVAGGG